MRKLKVKQRARRINKIREKRILNLNNERLCLIFDTMKDEFDFKKLKQTNFGFMYYFNENSISINQCYDESIGSSWNEFYINKDRLLVNDKMLDEVFYYMKEKYKNNKENRIDNFITKIN